jgi:hypothetical protein
VKGDCQGTICGDLSDSCSNSTVNENEDMRSYRRFFISLPSGKISLHGGESSVNQFLIESVSDTSPVTEISESKQETYYSEGQRISLGRIGFTFYTIDGRWTLSPDNIYDRVQLQTRNKRPFGHPHELLFLMDTGSVGAVELLRLGKEEHEMHPQWSRSVPGRQDWFCRMHAHDCLIYTNQDGSLSSANDDRKERTESLEKLVHFDLEHCIAEFFLNRGRIFVTHLSIPALMDPENYGLHFINSS